MKNKALFFSKISKQLKDTYGNLVVPEKVSKTSIERRG
jgi:hypothetical protein